jgi:hypothetical protein
MAEPARLLLVYVLIPLWMLAGLADWACHRATGIARTSGLRENLLHVLMCAEIAVALLAIALLEPTAGVLVLVAAVFLVHELTVWVDLRYTVPRRTVGPVEQMVHSFLEVFPLVALALLAVLAWDDVLALAGRAGAPDWSLRWKDRPLPPLVLAAGAVAGLLFNALPLAQETWSCLRARRDAARAA